MTKSRKMKLLVAVVLILCIAVVVFIRYKRMNNDQELDLYFVVNTQTESDEQGLLVGGDGNAKLSREGIETAKELGLGLIGTKFDAVYCSTLDRTYETAENILQQNGQTKLDIEDKQNLKDISAGSAEGYPKEEIASQYGDIYGSVTDGNFSSPVDGESAYTYAMRIDREIDKIIEEHRDEGGKILIVGHASLIYYLQQQFGEAVTVDELEAGSISLVKYLNGELTLESANDTSYLAKGEKTASTIPALQIDVVANPTTIHEAAGLLEGNTDSTLSADGIADAKSLAAQMSLGNVLAVFCSELDRSSATASYIIKDDDMKTYYRENLNEIYFGSLEAMSMDELQSNYPKFTGRLTSDNSVNAVKPENGESGEIAAYRLQEVLDEIVEDYEYSGGKVVVFTHPYILSAYMNEYFEDYTWRENGSIRWTSLYYDRGLTPVDAPVTTEDD